MPFSRPPELGVFECSSCGAARLVREGRSLGPYKLGEPVSLNASIYAAVCSRTAVRCTVREVQRDEPQQIFVAAEIYRALRHRGLIDVLALQRPDVGADGWIALAHRPGRELRLVDLHPRFTPASAAALFVEAAAALAALHAAGVAFGFLSPMDLTLTPSPLFGLPEMPLFRTEAGWSRYDADMLLGNSDYVAPELRTTGTPVPASDIYTLGLMLWELVTGIHPSSLSPSNSLVDRLLGNLAPLPAARSLRPDCPVWLDKAIARAVEVDPAARFPSMAAFEDALAGPG